MPAQFRTRNKKMRYSLFAGPATGEDHYIAFDFKKAPNLRGHQIVDIVLPGQAVAEYFGHLLIVPCTSRTQLHSHFTGQGSKHPSRMQR